MSGTIWTKFFWSDWLSETALRRSSYAARGLWIDMLCIAASHDPIGYVSVAGRGLSETDIARMTGGSEPEVLALLRELEQNGVFSRDRKGTIYSRRMVSDAKKSATAVKNGKTGGNPTLSNTKGNLASDIPPDKPPDNTPLKPHKPSASNPVKKEKGASALDRSSEGLFSDVPDWVPRSAWDSWVEMRAATRKPIKTRRAIQLAVSELDGLRKQGSDPLAVIELATLKSWTSFYPVKGDPKLVTGPGRAAGDDWRRKVEQFKTRNVWLSIDGPPPTDPDCCAPRPLLVEFGYVKAAA